MNYRDHTDETAALRAGVADLEAAMQPFAAYGRFLDKHFTHEDSVVAAGSLAAPMTFGDFRRASKLVGGKPHG